MCFCLGFKPITKVDTHTHTRLTQTLLCTHTDPACYSCLYGTHERDAHEDFLSQQKKWRPKQKCNTYENKKKKPFDSEEEEKKFFFSAAKTTGWIKAAGWPRSDLLRDCNVCALVSHFLGSRHDYYYISPLLLVFIFCFHGRPWGFAVVKPFRLWNKITSDPKDEFTLRSQETFSFETDTIDRPLINVANCR